MHTVISLAAVNINRIMVWFVPFLKLHKIIKINYPPPPKKKTIPPQTVREWKRSQLVKLFSDQHHSLFNNLQLKCCFILRKTWRAPVTLSMPRGGKYGMHVISQLNERYQPAPQTGGSFELSMFTMHTFRKWKSRHNHKCKICNGIKPLQLNYGCAQLIFFIVVSFFKSSSAGNCISVYFKYRDIFKHIHVFKQH